MAGLASLLGGGIGSLAGPVGSAAGSALAGAAAGAHYVFNNLNTVTSYTVLTIHGKAMLTNT